MMLVLGPAVGNYATSVVYRLPLGQTPFEKNPYCGDCGAMLAPKDLFPILSYLSTKGKCRYCGVKIRPSYTVVEVVCGVLFVINYLAFGISEDFILVTTIGVFLIILAGLEYHEKKLFTLIMTYLYALGAIVRALYDGTIYGFFYSGFIMLFVAIVCWRSMVALKKADPKVVPDYIWLAVLLGIMLPTNLLPAATLASLAVYGVQRVVMGRRLQTVAVSLVIYLGFLMPVCPKASGYLLLIQL